MTTKDLRYKVRISSLGRGSYRVTIEYRNKEYTCHSNNSLAYDRISEKEYIEDRVVSDNYTLKGAYLSIYKECKRKNGIK